MTGLIFLSICLVVAGGMTWSAVRRSREQRLWHALGATGWGILALSGFTDGTVELAIIAVALVVFGVGILIRQTNFGPDMNVI